MKKILTITVLLLCCFPLVRAQAPLKEKQSATSDTIKLPKYEPHLSVGTGFMATSNGDNRIYTSVAPSFIFRPSSRWTIKTGFGILTDVGLNPYYTTAATHSLAPLKRNGGTGLVSGHVAAQYRVNDNLWLSAAVYHVGGTYAPVFGFGKGNVLDVSATAFSAAADFKFNDDNFLHLSLTYIRDNYGTMPFLYHDAWMHSGYGRWGFYAHPTDYYRLCAPFEPAFYGGVF